MMNTPEEIQKMEILEKDENVEEEGCSYMRHQNRGVEI